MLGFKEFILEEDDNEYYNDVEFEGLTEMFDTIIHNDDIDPLLEEELLDNLLYSLNESTIDALKRNHETLKQAIGGALSRYKESYGQEIGKPYGGGTQSGRDAITELGRSAVEAHYKKTPEEQSEALKQAASRLGHVAYNDKTMTPEAVGARLSGGNAKTDTVINNPLVTHRGQLTSRVSSYGGAAGSYQHFASADLANSSNLTTCKDQTQGCAVGGNLDTGKKKKTKVTPSCLAKSGGYNFLPSQKKIQINSHIRSGEASIQDHAILVAHRMNTQAEKSDATDTIHAVRGQTTDQRGQDIRAIARETAKFRPVVGKRTVMFGYSKNPNEVLDAARMNKANQVSSKSKDELPEYKEGYIPEYITHSHPGPAYHQKLDGSLHINTPALKKLQALRDAHATADKEGLNVNDYVVLGGHALEKDGSATKIPYRQPKQPSDKTGATRRINLANETNRFYHNDASVKHMRYWDLHHSGELQPHEPESFHDEKTNTGYGTIEQDGKKYKIGYHDREANLGATESGRTNYEKHERHDGRYADAEQKKSSVQITAPVSSTSNPNATGVHALTLAHQIHVSHDVTGTKFRHSKPGMLHDAQPELMQKAGFKYKSTFRAPDQPPA